MKVFKYKITLLLALVMISFSCSDFLGDENADPNKPNEVAVTGQLTNVEIILADVWGGAFSRHNCMFTQQVEGVARQWTSFNQYVLTPNRFDASWANVYENALVEIKTIKELSIENGYNHYQGVANVMEALAISMATDVWGDIPYTEAVLGAENFTPAFDDQATVIYPAIFNLLNEAITLFNGSAGTVIPGGEDVFFGGDISLWIKGANALLARSYLHQGDYASALAAAQASFEGSSESMAYNYPDVNDGGNWYRFNIGRTGDLEFHPFLRSMMEGFNDEARLGMWDQVFDGSHPYLVAAFKQDVISYREMQFVIAETAFRTGASGATIRDAYLNGIEASFADSGVPEAYAAYVAQASVDPGVGNITLDHIMTQKYISLFTQAEVFSDWRRTGIPALTPVSGLEIPRKWDYGNNTYLFNSENAPAPSNDAIFGRVDWDN